MVVAQGKKFHPEHFNCTECGKILSPNNFFEKDGLPYCEDDFHKLFSPRCAGCGEPIRDVSEYQCLSVVLTIVQRNSPKPVLTCFGHRILKCAKVSKIEKK